MKWSKEAVERERSALERARRRFIDKPTEKRLHAVRTSGRRLRSLLEDLAGIQSNRRLLQRVKRAAAVTDAARDATILFRLLDNSVSDDERPIAAPLLDELKRREAAATKLAHRRLVRARFA